MGEISGSVTGKKEELDSTVSSLVAHVGDAIQEGSKVVQETAETANTVLADITNATEVMQRSSYEAVDAFTSFLDGKGEGLSVQLDEHFKSLETRLAAGESIVNEVGGSIALHCSSNDSLQVIPTGSIDIDIISKARNQLTYIFLGCTPKKTKYAPLPTLVSTREHVVIKTEAKAAKSER